MATVYAVIWDDADPAAGSAKLRRAIYATQAQAVAQAEHDLKCLRCSSSGKEDSNWGPQECRDCGGSGKRPEHRVVCVEKLTTVDRDEMNRGTIVWEPPIEQG